MELDKIYVGIITEIDAEQMLAKAVIYGSQDFPTDWLMLSGASGFYFIPAVGDQCMIAMDEHMDDGIVLGYVNNRKERNGKDLLGVDFAGIQIEIDRQTGKASLKLLGDVSLEMPNLSIKGNLKIQGDVDITGKSKMVGDVAVTGKVDATGIIKSTTDVQTATLKLSTHMHPTAGTGPPSPPIPGA